MKHIKNFKLDKKGMKVILIGIAVIALPQIFTGHFQRHVMVMSLVWAIIGMGWNILGGYTGQVSNGHALYYTIGAYAGAIGMYNFNITPWITMWIGVVISIGLAYILGTPLLRLKGHYFAVASMALAECARYIFLNTPALGGAVGINFYNGKLNPWYSMQFPSKTYYYYIFLGFAVAVIILVKKIEKSKLGYYFRTIKGNEMAAESVGIDTAKYKMIAYILSVSVVSIGGSLYVQYMLYVDPYMILTLNISMMIVLVAVMGGIGTVYGPIIGAIVLTVISEYSRSFFAKIGSGFDFFLYGILVIIIVLFVPNGLISIFKRKKKVDTSVKDKVTT